MHDAGEILQRAFDGFKAKLEAHETHKPGGFRMPSRQFIHVGELAYDDGDMFVVHAGPIYQGIPGQNAPGYQVSTGGVATLALDFSVSLIRESPIMDNAGRLPKDTEMTKAAMNAMDDSKKLVEAFYALAAEDAIAGPCDIIYNNGVTFVGPAGTLLGVQLNLAIQL